MQRTERKGDRERGGWYVGRGSGAYFDEDGLHSLGTAEPDIPGYCPTTTISGRRSILVLTTQGDSNEVITPQKHTRMRHPARTRGRGERALG